MTIAKKIEYFQKRARQERERAELASCREARLAHIALALEHERAAEREHARLAKVAEYV